MANQYAPVILIGIVLVGSAVGTYAARAFHVASEPTVHTLQSVRGVVQAIRGQEIVVQLSDIENNRQRDAIQKYALSPETIWWSFSFLRTDDNTLIGHTPIQIESARVLESGTPITIWYADLPDESPEARVIFYAE